MPKLKVLIPSYNRVAQLHLLLESLERNFADFENLDIHVLWKTSSTPFWDGYKQLWQSHLFPNVKIEHEYNFRKQILNALKANEYVLFFTDDCIFYDEYRTSVEDTLKLIKENVHSFSFRLGVNTEVQNYLTGELQPSVLNYYHAEIKNEHDSPSLKWLWKLGHTYWTYSYPFSWDGHIYRSKDLLDIVKNKTFKNPRDFETIFAADPNIKEKIRRRLMMSPYTSKVFVNSVNVVQVPPVPAGLLHPYSPEFLNQKYLDGYKINLDSLDIINIESCHSEREFDFIKR